MLQFQQVKVGDYLMANNDGDVLRGEVTNLKHGENQVCLDIGAQEFWYEMDQLSAIPLNEDELLKLKFTKEQQEDGTVKYLKGAFRVLVPSATDFSKLEIWYRDEHRHIYHALNVHEFQNHYHDMTKVHLTEMVY